MTKRFKDGDKVFVEWSWPAKRVIEGEIMYKEDKQYYRVRLVPSQPDYAGNKVEDDLWTPDFIWRSKKKALENLRK